MNGTGMWSHYLSCRKKNIHIGMDFTQWLKFQGHHWDLKNSKWDESKFLYKAVLNEMQTIKLQYIYRYALDGYNNNYYIFITFFSKFIISLALKIAHPNLTTRFSHIFRYAFVGCIFRKTPVGNITRKLKNAFYLKSYERITLQ